MFKRITLYEVCATIGKQREVAENWWTEEKQKPISRELDQAVVRDQRRYPRNNNAVSERNGNLFIETTILSGIHWNTYSNDETVISALSKQFIRIEINSARRYYE